MKILTVTIQCLLATIFGKASAGPSLAIPVVRARNAPGMSTDQTLRHLARSLNAIRVQGRDVSFASNKTVLDTAWSGATLLKQGLSGEKKRAATAAGAFDVEIVCQTCYIRGAASASLTVKGDISDTISNYTTAIRDEVLNITKTVASKVGDTITDTVSDIFTGEVFEDDYDFEFPTMSNITFDLDLPPLPGVSVKFQFEDDFELYMLLNTKLAAGATYTLNLFASKSALGIAIGSDITAGVAVVIDLILDVSTSIDISSGFHLKLGKGVGFELNMFSQNVSNIAFPGGQFEFLPVTIVSEGVVLKGVLRITLKAGLELDTSGVASVLDKTPFNVEAGLVAEVFANVAEFMTNVTGPALASNNAKPKSNTGCELEVVEAYQFALGAAAGATVAVGIQTWGPMPSTTIPIFYTTLASACAIRKPLPPTAPAAPPGPTSPSPSGTRISSSGGGLLGIFNRATAPAGLDARQATSLTTKTLTSTAVFTGQYCKSSGVINCPASLQISSTYKSIITLVTAVASGVKPTFPVTKVASVTSAVPFGKEAKQMISSSGTPTSFIPGPTGAAGDIKAWLDGNTGGLSNKAVLGLAVGLGVPVLAAIIGGVVYCCRQRRYAPVLSNASSSLRMVDMDRTPSFAPMTYKGPVVRVSER